MKSFLLRSLEFIIGLFPNGTPTFIYTSVLKPKPLKKTVNKIIMAFIPETIKVGGEQNQVIVALNKKDPVVCGALMLGVYEKFESRLIREKLKPGMTVVDIGANIGYYTAIAAEAVGPNGFVIAFEPEPENFSYLKKTVALNNFKNVKCHQFGISDFEGKTRLFLSPEGNKGDNRIYASPDQRLDIEINLVTLDGFFLQRRILPRRISSSLEEKVDLIKMDIQGAEGLAIQGMKKTMNQNHKIKLFTEFWPLGIERTGVEPLSFLYALNDLGLKIHMINQNNGGLEPVKNFEDFAQKFRGRQFANLYCER